MHKIPSIRTLTQTMKKNHVMLDANKYIEQLMCEATSDDLQLITENIQSYMSGPTTLRTMFYMLQDGLDIGFRTIYPEAIKERVSFGKDIIK